MNDERRRRPPTSDERWVATAADLADEPGRAVARREPLTLDGIVGVALDVVRRSGYDALTMRRLASVLGVVPGALYVHVRDRTTLDDLMVARLCARITLPAPDPGRWREQILDLCTQLRDQWLDHPGLPRAALTAAPRSLETLRVNESAVAVLMSGGVPLQDAVWAVDAAFLYVNAYSTVASRRSDGSGAGAGPADRDRVLERFAGLPVEQFPISSQNPEVMVSGAGHDRFAFTLRLLFDGLG